jgi:PKD repeat protein
MKLYFTKLRIQLFFVILFFFQSIISFDVSAQTCKQVDILFTELPCFHEQSTGASPADPSDGCAATSACIDSPNKYFSSLTGAGIASYLWSVTGPSAVTYAPNITSSSVTISYPTIGIYTILLTVTDTGGNVFTNCLTVNVKEKPIAGFTFSPNNVCAGNSINFINTSTYSSGGMVYSWNFGDPTSGVSNSSTSTNPSHIFGAAGNYNVCLITSSFTTERICTFVQGKDVCEYVTKTCCSDTVCQTVNITPGALMIDCISTVCAGQTVTYTTPGCSNVTWATPIGGTIISSTPSSITITWGNGTVQGQINGTCVGGCTASVPVPIIPLNPQAVGDLTPCTDATTSYSLPILPGTFYTWTLTNVTTPATYTGAPQIYTFPENNTVWVNWGAIPISPGDVFTLTAKLDNEHICCHTIGSITITPKEKFIALTDQTVCLNDLVNLTVSPTVGTFSWLVSPNSGFTAPNSNLPTFTPTFTAPGEYLVTVNETAGTYCINSKQVKITVLPATPAPGIIIGPATVCANSPVGYSMSIAAPSGYHYVWNITGLGNVFMPGALTTTTGDNVNINWNTIPGTVSVFLERNSAPLCPSATVSYTVSAATVGTVTGTPNVCVDGNGTYTLTGGNLPPGETVTWSIAPAGIGTIILGQGTNNITVLWHGLGGTGPWTGVVSATTSCGPASGTQTVTIYPKFTFSLSQNQDICQVGGATLTPTVVANSPTYLWSNAATTSTISVTTPGTYTLQITNAGGCTFSKFIEVKDPLKVIPITCGVGTCLANGNTTEVIGVSATAPGPITYQWYSGVSPSGSLLLGETNSTYTAIVDGPYYCVVTYGTGVGVCTKVIPFTVAKVCCPDINIPRITFVKQINCFQYDFIGVANPTGAALTWYWGDGTTSVGVSGATISHTYAHAGNYCVKFCAGPPAPNPTSCTGNCTSTTVVVPIEAIYTFNQRCNGCIDITDLSINLAGGAPASVTYQWTLNGNPVFAGVNPPQLCPPSVVAGNNTLTLTMTYNNGLPAAQNITCSSVNTQTFIYTPLSISVVPNPVCTNIPATFTSVPSGFITYNWDFDDGNFAFSSSTTHTYSIASPPTYNVGLSVTDLYGTVCTATLPLNVLTGAPCTILPAYICSGDPATLIGPVGGTAYAWEVLIGPNWVPATGTNNAVNYTTTTPGTYRVKVTNANGCVCISNAVTVLAVSKPIAKIKILPSQKICSPGGSVTLTSLNHITGYISNWYNVTTSTPINPNSATINDFITVTTTYQLTLTNQYGCTDVCSVTVEVNPLPAPPIISAVPPTLCEGTPTTLTITPYLNNNSWSTGEQTNSIIVSTAGAYTGTHTDPATGCSSSKTIIVHKRPSTLLFPHFCDKVTCTCTVPFTIYGPKPLIGPFAASPPYIIQWYDALTNTLLFTGQDYTPAPTGSYYIRIQDPTTGCISKSDNYAITVPTAAECAECSCTGGSYGAITLSTIKPISTINIACGKSETIACITPYILNATFNCSAVGCASYVTYSITDPLFNTVTGTLPYNFVAPISGTYSVVLTGYCNGIKCTSCAFSFIACPALEVNLVSFTGKKEGKKVELFWETASEKGNSYYLLERSIDSQKFINLTKIFPKNTFSNETLKYTFTDLFPADGINYYRLKAVDINGVTTNSKIISVDFEEYGPPKIYPNPSKATTVTLKVPSENPGKIQIEWFDVLGHLVKTSKNSVAKGENKFEMEVNDLPAGKYVVRIIYQSSSTQDSKVLSFEKL